MLIVGARDARAVETTEEMTVTILVPGKTLDNDFYKLAPFTLGTPRAGADAQLSAGYKLPNNEQDLAGDPDAHARVTYSWSCSANATLAPLDARDTALSTAPETAGLQTFTASVHVTYWPGTGETTYVGDASAFFSQYIAQKVWSAGSGIGVVLDEQGNPQKDPNNLQLDLQDGRMTAPQDQRSKPRLPNGQFPVPLPVRAAPSARLNCAVETASDKDHWDKAAENPQQSTKGDEADARTYKWTCDGGKFYIGDNEDGTPKYASEVKSSGATWQAPPMPGNYTLSCAIDDTPTAVAAPDAPIDTLELKARDDAAISRSVSVTVWQAALRVKNKSALDAAYGAAASVAEGAIANNAAHQADVEVTVSDVNGNLLSGVAIPNLVIASGGRGPQANTEAAIFSTFGATNLAGKSFGIFTSGNREETTVIKLPYDRDNPKTGAGPTASMVQVWNDLPGGNGAGHRWDYEEYYDYDTPTEVAYNIAYNTAYDIDQNGVVMEKKVDVSGHHLEFVATKMSGAVWNPTAGPDEDGDGVGDGDYVQDSFERNNAGFDAPVSAGSSIKRRDLIEWSPKVATSASRKYTTDLKVKYNWDFIIDALDFNVYDNDAFGPEGDTGD